MLVARPESSHQWRTGTRPTALLHLATVAGVIKRSREQDQNRAAVLAFDSLFTAAAVFAWSEFHRRDDGLAVVGRYVQHPFAELDSLVQLFEDHALLQMMLPMVKYHQWFQPLVLAVHELPDRPVRDGGIGFSVEKEHDSPLIAGAAMMFGAEDCLEGLVARVAEEREACRVRLVRTLRAVHAVKGDRS